MMSNEQDFNNQNNKIVLSRSDGALNGYQFNESSKSSITNISTLNSSNKVNTSEHLHRNCITNSQSTYIFPGYTHDNNNSSHFSDSFPSLYLPQFAHQISTTIMSGLNWINQINATTLFQNIWTSGFLRRRFSQSARCNNDQPEVTKNDTSVTYSQYKFAKILNGTIRLQTLKPSELIELSSFGLVELDDDVEPGIGHEFQRYENNMATWCDSCGEFLFPSVMNEDNADGQNYYNNIVRNENNQNIDLNQTASEQPTNLRLISATTPASVQADHLLRTYFQCSKCKYVCHWKCLNLIRIDCQPSEGCTTKTSEISGKNSSKVLPTAIDNNNNHNESPTESFESVNGSIETLPEDQRLMDISSCTESVFDDENFEAIKSEPKAIDNIVVKDVLTKESNNDAKIVESNSYLITPRIILDLKAKILKYNERVRSKGSGLGITLIDEEKCLFRGFLRVYMNLTRPINVIAGKRPPSIYDIINEEENNQRRTLTSFYMPRDTVKNIHITSDSTSLQVIKAMLKKFKVVDNPQKFALYLRRRFPEEELIKTNDGQVMIDENSSTRISDDYKNDITISKFLKTAGNDHSLKRLNDHERPLILQLEFDSFAYGSVDIVLQENDNADIAWDAFEIPELKNFLKILDREEDEHLEHVKAHYHELKCILQALIDYEEKKLLSEKNKRSSNDRSPHPGSSILTVTS